MGSLSDYGEAALLNHVFNSAYTSVATLYVALATATLTDAATGASMSEVANTNAYARTAITFGAAASRQVQQSGAVTFPTASGAWGTITSWAIVDSATYGAGNVLAYGDFTASFAPVAGNTPTIPSGEIRVQMLPTQYTASTIAVTNATTITDSANGLPLYPAGSIVYLTGFSGGQAANNNTALTVFSSAVGTMTFTGSSLVTGAAGPTITVGLSGGFATTTVHLLLNRMFRNQAYAKPATYVGLATAVITDAAALNTDVTEVSGGNYARKQVNIAGGAVPAWNTASGGVVTNANAVQFNTPSASWGLVTSCFLIDSASGGGNIIGYDNNSIIDQTPVANDTVLFDIGQFSNAMS